MTGTNIEAWKSLMPSTEVWDEGEDAVPLAGGEKREASLMPVGSIVELISITSRNKVECEKLCDY